MVTSSFSLQASQSAEWCRTSPELARLRSETQRNWERDRRATQENSDRTSNHTVERTNGAACSPH